MFTHLITFVASGSKQHLLTNQFISSLMYSFHTIAIRLNTYLIIRPVLYLITEFDYVLVYVIVCVKFVFIH